LEGTWLQRAKVTLDPLHANLTTLETINQSGGKYIVQIKKNQPILFEMFGLSGILSCSEMTLN